MRVRGREGGIERAREKGGWGGGGGGGGGGRIKTERKRTTEKATFE